MRRGIVIYDTKYGNTEKIAKAFEQGLRESDIQSVCTNAKDIAPESLEEYDLIAVGAPTQMFTASKPIKEFLEKMKTTHLTGKFGFAFDTKLDSRLSGSAAKYIEKELQNLGLEILLPRASAIVIGLKEKEGGAKLKELEESRFQKIGVQVGTALAAKKRMIPA